MKRLIVVGAGGHGAVVAEAAAAGAHWAEIQFLDDDAADRATLEFPLAGNVARLTELADERTEFIVALGNNRNRLALSDAICDDGLTLATVIHPSAVISASVEIGSGTVACAGAIVNARAKIGRACILNSAATVDHDCVLAAGVHISPGAHLAGNVSVGECAWVGIGTAVREGIQIGADAIIGVGSAVVSDVGRGETVVGVPARRMET